MLVLTRKPSEKLIIGDNEITVTILSISGNQVKLGVEAPKHVSVHREEIALKIAREKELKNAREANK